ncbi:uncharacterized protein LOC105182270 isoform X1 [Harpegnathos saltator]|uniref:uncharacterized protein LOC105182270 isoform X1 n=1 Tax=Harpegnathos saltator TaxID=610380 RepID=UPI000DBEDF2F|nr:uncharacterized protein LOC105182270 isoform X1 [Harpegnathos saltator]XP_025159314.1 uncharacterized protein LOC105182270 isoform X1 [Harpegnathos saltator]
MVITVQTAISDHVWIGAREDSPDSWFWLSGGNRMMILRNVSRRNVVLRYSNSSDEDLRCLSIDRVSHDASVFVSLRCNQRKPFMCQRGKEKSSDASMKMMSSTRIDKEEFILYSTRLTWPEAVMSCRKEGLQIAEVKTTAEAQSLAFLMIRARPESIENAWIGGYANDNTWKWLPSGSNISNNDLWRDDNGESHGCLLLDRHVCELPVYLGAKCDRKRDVICQKPSFKKWISEKPVPVYIGGCSYWIGFRELTWFQAQLSCKELNASLVILDSPRVISHMISLMEDNRGELRHIWTDGRRKLMKLDGTTTRRWIWESSGEPVSEIGASFVPWCTTGQCHNDNGNCLNVDRADHDTPIVYGLSCKQSQTYVCQPWSGACVARRTNSKESPASLHDNNHLPRLLPSAETTTTSHQDEEVNREETLRAIVPSSINASRSLPSKSTSRFNDLLGNNNTPLLKNNETFDGMILRLKHSPFRVFDGRSMLYGNVRMYPWAFRPFVLYPLIGRYYYYYYPRHYLRSDKRKIMLYR